MSQQAPVPIDLALFERIRAFRRDLHAHPELAWQESRTAGQIEARLRELGLAPWRPTPTSVACDLPDAAGSLRARPLVALRADTDALPIEEQTGLSFASTRPGVMHACGHDGHSAMLIGATELLLRRPSPVPTRLFWQPAEEHGSGAAAMIAAGVLDGVGAVFGCHLDRCFLPGQLAVTDGPVNASTDQFRVQIHGRAGHGGRPHQSQDAVVVGSMLVVALQSIVSREVDPACAAVLTIGSFHAGTASNVIAGQATLDGTIRARQPSVRDQLVGALHRVSAAMAELHDVRIEVDMVTSTPALINQPQPTALARHAAVLTVGAARVCVMNTANMGGEDFACYLAQVPGCYIRIGSKLSGREGFPAHSPRFDIDERALGVGASWLARMSEVAGEALRSGALRVGALRVGADP